MSTSSSFDRPASGGASSENGASSMWSWGRTRPAGRLHTSALQAAETPPMARWIMTGSLVVLAALVLALTFVPWQQTVTGSGEVTVVSPDARPRPVESQIPARVQAWMITEGDTVAQGDTVAVLQDLSSSYLSDRFSDRIAENRAGELRALQLKTEQARRKLSQARQALRSARAAAENAHAQTATARDRYARVESLHADGLSSLRELETAQLKLRKARSDSVAATSDLEAARQGVSSARLDVERQQSALEAKRATLDLKVGNARERQAASVVRAPIDGVVARINRAGPGQTVKKGGELALIVPTTDDQAVELFVNSVDAAIVDPGRRVQLQFAGFPALQFGGFPNASAGTFSGRVRFIAPVDDASGRYRVVVVPDTSGTRPEWPSRSYLRQGSAATGSILLSNVSLGYEIWRRLNGLPPQIPVQDKSFKRTVK